MLCSKKTCDGAVTQVILFERCPACGDDSPTRRCKEHRVTGDNLYWSCMCGTTIREMRRGDPYAMLRLHYLHQEGELAVLHEALEHVTLSQPDLAEIQAEPWPKTRHLKRQPLYIRVRIRAFPALYLLLLVVFSAIIISIELRF